MTKPEERVRPRLIVLGASNVARAISMIVRTMQRNVNGPADYLFVFGHGRSYGGRSRVLGRSLPGILESGLWSAIGKEADPGPPTRALITDIGNDVLYGASASQIVEWVGECADRLLAQGAEVTLTELPMASVEGVGPKRYSIVRSLFFPRCHLTFDETMGTVRDLHVGLKQLAIEKKITLIPQRGEWFGVDPIHIHRRTWNNAWPTILAPLVGVNERVPLKADLGLFLYLRKLCPLERSILGIRHGHIQPCGRLADGSTISYY